MEVTRPTIQPTLPPAPALGFAVAVTGTHAKISSTDYACFGVLIQSSAKNDSNSAMSGVMYVEVNTVKVYELVQGEAVFIPCSNTSEVYVITQTGTAFARGLIYRDVTNQ
jgi:hypothetical protein